MVMLLMSFSKWIQLKIQRFHELTTENVRKAVFSMERIVLMCISGFKLYPQSMLVLNIYQLRFDQP